MCTRWEVRIGDRTDARGSAARPARGDAVLPRRPDAGRDRVAARSVPADRGPAGGQGEGQRTGADRGRSAPGHLRGSARRRRTGTGTPLRPHRGHRGRQRRAGRRRDADAPHRCRRRPRFHVGARAGLGGHGPGFRCGELPRGRAARRRHVHRGLPDRHRGDPHPVCRHATRRDLPVACTAVRRPGDRGVDAGRLGDLPDAGCRPASRHDAVRGRRGVDVDDAVRGQLPGHPHARRARRPRRRRRDRRPVLQRARRARARRTSAAGHVGSAGGHPYL